MTAEAEAKYWSREKEYMAVAKDLETTKTELETRTEELKKLKGEYELCVASLEVYRQPKSSLCEELLGQLHEFVSDTTKEIEMSEPQEEEYQRIMGALDETIKTIESQKADLVKEVHGYKNTVTGLEMQNEDLADRLKKVEEQNKGLKEQSKEITSKLEKTKQVEEEEWTKLQSRLEELEGSAVGKLQEISKQKDLLKHRDEDLEELKKKYESNQAECLSLAKQVTEVQAKHSALEAKYKLLKQKYAESRDGNMKKYEARIRAKEKELEAIMERKYNKKQAGDESEQTKEDTEQNSAQDSDTEQREPEQPTESDTIENRSTKIITVTTDSDRLADSISRIQHLEQENEALKRELEESSSEKASLEQKIEVLTEQIQQANKKKKPQPEPAEKPAATDKTSRVALNTKRVDDFLLSVDKNVRVLYKEFIVWATAKTVDITRVADMQKNLNIVLELVDDFKEYCSTKTGGQ